METAPAGVLKACDEFVIEIFCVAVATFHEAHAMIKKSSLLVRGTEGNLTLNPLLRIRSRSMAEMRAGAIELGLSPSSRTRLTKEPTADDDRSNAVALGRR